MPKTKWDGFEGEGSQRREGAKQPHRWSLKTGRERWSGRKKFHGNWGEDPVGHRGDTLKCLGYARSRSQEDEPEGYSYSQKHQTRQDRWTWRGKKHWCPLPFPRCSSCSVSPVAQCPGCRHQGWREAEHSSPTHPQEEQGDPALDLSISPSSQGSWAAPSTKGQRQKAYLPK